METVWTDMMNCNVREKRGNSARGRKEEKREGKVHRLVAREGRHVFIPLKEVQVQLEYTWTALAGLVACTWTYS